MAPYIVRRFHLLVAAVLIVPVLVLFEGCKADGDQPGAVPNPTLAARAAQLALASAAAQLEHEQHATGMNGSTGKSSPEPVASTGAPSPNGPVPAMGVPDDSIARPTARLLGEPLDPSSANAAGGLPAALGAPHLYHLAADGFFLNQANAIGLTDEQRQKLTALKEHAAAAFAAMQLKVRQSEKDLWVLACSDAPDDSKMEAKVAEIGRLGVQQRMDFIRTLGKAVAVLSDVQRKAVVAQNIPAQQAPMPAATSADPKVADPTSAGGVPPPSVVSTTPDPGAAPGMGHM